MEIKRIDSVFVSLENATKEELNKLRSVFKYYIKGYQYHPKVKSGWWDGTVSLIESGNKIYSGLVPEIVSVCNDLDIKISIDKDIWSRNSNFSEKDVLELAKKAKHTPYESQIKSVFHCINTGRCLIVSATGSGKSFSFFLISRYYKKVLIVVPTTQLTSQIAKEFRDYDLSGNISEITEIRAGKDKNNCKDITISTWQSLLTIDDCSWFDQFDCVIVDECHEATKICDKKMAIVHIMERCKNIDARFAFTGSLKNTDGEKMVLKGLFGPIFQTSTFQDLDVNCNVVCISLKYNKNHVQDFNSRIPKKANGKELYEIETKFIEENVDRTKYISELIKKIPGNSLVTYTKIDHGKSLFNQIESDKKHLINGSTKLADRENSVKECETESNVVIVASLGTFKRGISITNLHNIILGSSVKGGTNTLTQVVGRGTRTNDTKKSFTLYDISDNINNRNITLKQFKERLKDYYKEGFDIKFVEVEL